MMARFSNLKVVLIGFLGGLLCSACQRTVPDQTLFASNSYLSHAIDRAIKAEFGPGVDERSCIRPNPGFTPQECVVVRWNRDIPLCPTRAYEDGRCYAIELRASLLADERVVSIIDEASREFCSFAVSSNTQETDTEYAIGCTSHAEWRLIHRQAPLTICVSGIGAGTDEEVVTRFAIRDGERVDDVWCDTLFASGE